MAAQAAEATEGEDEKKGGKGRLIVIAVAALLVLGGGGAGAAWFFGLLGGGDGAAASEHGGPAPEAANGHGEAAGAGHGGESAKHGSGEAVAAEEGTPPSADGVYFVDLPDVLVNLRSEGRRMRYLKLRVALEVRDAETAGAVRTLMPRVMDSLQLYLRSLSVEDVRGAIGMERLKEEMLARINRAIRPHRVDDVLFKEMLVQ